MKFLIPLWTGVTISFFRTVLAKQRGITDIVTGVCETDFSGYPDCRDVFVKSLNVTLI